MIRIEDGDFAEFSLKEGEIAVPFEIVRMEGTQEAEITVYEVFLPIAEEFVRLHGEDPFSDSAVDFLKDRLTGPMQAYGFCPSREIGDRIRLFKIQDPDAVRTSAIQENTRIVSGRDDLSALRNLTTHTLEMDGDDSDDISAVVVVDSCIAAFATENDAVFGEPEIEISVECAPAFRGRGMASSCTAALALELLKRGYDVTYKCRHRNAASARVAEKAGFCEIGMQYSFVCYRD